MKGTRILTAAIVAVVAGGVAGVASSPASAAAPKPVSVKVSPIGELLVEDAAGLNNVKVHTMMGSGGSVLVSSSAPITIGRNCRPFATVRFQNTVSCTGITTVTYLFSGGDDYLEVNSFSSNLFMDMGDGNDVVKLLPTVNRPTTIFGGIGNDTITGGSAVDFVRGGDGVDTIKGMDGNDDISGDAGKDVLSGNAGQDRIAAQDGEADKVDCGQNPAGQKDFADLDPGTLDKQVSCETVI